MQVPEDAHRDRPAGQHNTTTDIGDTHVMRLRFILTVSFALAFLAGCAGTPEQFVAPNDQLGAADVQRI
ncbi:MAG: hypothetical protein AAFX59_16345, partial [Pseudomonadota bacterium]